MKKLLSLAVLVPILVSVGCNSVGDTNPVSPDEMEKIRNKTATDRANFKPDAGRPPSGN